jgi:hypothetical protein
MGQEVERIGGSVIAPRPGLSANFRFRLAESGLLAYRLRNSWVMPATTAVASTQPKTIMSQV